MTHGAGATLPGTDGTLLCVWTPPVASALLLSSYLFGHLSVLVEAERGSSTGRLPGLIKDFTHFVVIPPHCPTIKSQVKCLNQVW